MPLGRDWPGTPPNSLTLTNPLIVLVLYELDDDLLLRLNLEHLQHQAKELGGLLVPAKSASQVCEHHRLVHKRFGR